MPPDVKDLILQKVKKCLSEIEYHLLEKLLNGETLEVFVNSPFLKVEGSRIVLTKDLNLHPLDELEFEIIVNKEAFLITNLYVEPFILKKGTNKVVVVNHLNAPLILKKGETLIGLKQF